MNAAAREAAEKAFYECEGNNPACIHAAIDAYEATRGAQYSEMLAALKEANAFILAPAEDIKDGVLSRLRAAIVTASA